MRTHPRTTPDPAHGQDAARIERALARTRVLLACVSLIAVYLDPFEPTFAARETYTLLALYGAFSVVVLAAAEFGARWLQGVRPAIHVIDVMLAAAVTFLTQGASSPFFVYFVFVLFGAAARWGLSGALATGTVAVSLFVLQAWLAPLLMAGEPAELTRTIMRVAYLLLLTLTLGVLAAHQRALRSERTALSGVMAAMETAGTFLDRLRVVLAECVAYYGASEAIAVIEVFEPKLRHVWLSRRDAHGNAGALEEVDAPDDAPYWQAPPPGSVVWRVRRGPATLACHAIVAAGNRLASFDGTFAASLLDRHAADVALAAEARGAHEWRARLILLDPAHHGRDAMEFLHLLTAHVAPALHNDYLLSRLRSRVSAAERASIAREIHDGPIQSLIGLEMATEARRLHARGTPGLEADLLMIRDGLRRCVGDLRDLMVRLKPAPPGGRHVLRQVAEMADRLRREQGLNVSVLSTVSELRCRPRMSVELARIAQEALSNIRKHSGATRVTIAITETATTGRMIVEDDGRGLGFSGRLSLEDLEAREMGPAQILQRVRTIGADLVIDSQPGRGTRVEVEWPLDPSDPPN